MKPAIGTYVKGNTTLETDLSDFHYLNTHTCTKRLIEFSKSDDENMSYGLFSIFIGCERHKESLKYVKSEGLGIIMAASYDGYECSHKSR